MTEIPEDIMKTARETVALIEQATNVYWPDVVEELIGFAILAERKRCAEYARSYLEDISGCDMADDEPEQVAAGIMTGEKFDPPPIDFPEGGKE